MTETVRRPPRALDRRGSATTELVLAIPFLVFILALLFFFGRAFVRVQHAQMTARYEAWRAASAAPGPHADNADLNRDLNDLFFAGRAEAIAGDTDGWRLAAASELVEAAEDRSGDAGRLAEASVNMLPGQRRWRIAVTHPGENRVLEPFEQSIARRHSRMSGDWRYASGPPRNVEFAWEASGPLVTGYAPVRAAFLTDLDQFMRNMEGNRLANTIRGLYSSSEGLYNQDSWRIYRAP